MKKRNKSEPEHEAMLTLSEAAAMLRSHPNTVRAWVRQGKLTTVEMGVEKVAMFRKREVEALVEPLQQAGVIIRDDKQAFPVVGIGASAGGLEAVSRLLKELPTDLGLAYVFISHLEAGQEAILADLLRKTTAMPVMMVENGMKLERDRLYVGPGAMHVSIVEGTFMLQKAHGKNDVTPRAIDAFFSALADEYQNNSIGILLSGTGVDGTEGLHAIRVEGGLAIVQDASAKNGSMPRNAEEAGVVDLVLRPEDIGKELADLVKQLYPGGQASIPSKHQNELRRILNYLEEKRGVDFSQYKESTIHRRIIRRMVLSKCRRLSDYSTLLRGIPSEVDTLYNDLLINVSSFFRDPQFFKSLATYVLPALFQERTANDPLRIWVSACAGGEEVVSIAITLLEFLGDHALTTPVQIFATDLNEHTIEKARLGIYKKSALQNISPERIKQFFTHVDGHFQVIKSIRDLCVFAKHDLLKDPPFSRIDLISCQNVLIYMESAAQGRILKSFHYAMKPSGFMALGKSETISGAHDLFLQPEREHKIYTRTRKGPARLNMDVKYKPAPLSLAGNSVPRLAQATQGMSDLDRDTDKLLLHRYVPASVLVNKDMEIVRFRGPTAPFLSPSAGKASLNLLKMVRDDLAFELRTLLQKAKKERMPVRKSGVPIHMNEAMHDVGLEVVPIAEQRDPHYLVLFKEEGLSAIPATGPPDGRKWTDLRDARERKIVLLEQELRDLREQMRVAAEDAEANDQELQAANEEVVSSNEELQSINEELETSKEELQSINEEFATINEELQARNDALMASEERYRQLVQLMPVAVYTCDTAGYVRTFNDAAVKLWGRAPVIGESMWAGAVRMFDRDGTVLPLDRTPMALAIKEDRAIKDVEVVLERANGERRIVLSNPAPLHDAKGQLTGAINVLVDVTERIEYEQRLQLATKVGKLGIWDWDVVDNVIEWTDAVFSIHGVDKGSFEPTMTGYHELIHPEDRERVGAAIKKSLEEDAPYEIEFRTLNKAGTVNWVYTSAVVVREAGRPVRMLGGTMNVTERKDAEEALRLTNERFRLLADNMDQLAWMATADGTSIWFNRRWEDFSGIPLDRIRERAATELHHPDHYERVTTSVRAAAAKGESWQGSFPLKGKDGQWHWFLSSVMPFKNDAGEVVRWFGTSTDITALREAQESIAQKEKFNRTVLEGSPDCVNIMDQDGHLTYMNTQGQCLMEIDDFDTVRDQEWWSLWPEETRPRIRQAVERAKQGENTHFQAFSPTAKGTPKWWDVIVTPVPSDNGTTSVLSVSRDITEQRTIEESLRTSEEQYRSLFANMTGGIAYCRVIHDADGGMDDFEYLAVNEAYSKLTGRPPEEVVGKRVAELIPGMRERFPLPFQVYSRVARTGDPESFEFELRPGMWVWITAFSPRKGYFVSMFDDITERRRGEASSRRLVAIVQDSADAILSKDLNSIIQSWNAGAEHIFGYTAEEMIGQSITKLIPKGREDEEPRILERIRKGERIQHFETVRVRKDGSLVDVSISVSPVRDAEGRVIGASKIARDISENKRLLDAMHTANEQLQMVTDNMPVAVARLSRDLRYVWASQGYLDWLGLSVKAVEGRRMPEVIGEEAFGAVRSPIDRALLGEHVETEIQLDLPSRGKRWINAIYAPLYGSSGEAEGWIEVITDITRRKELEEALQDADRHKDHFLATLAHELRNPLAPLKSGIQLLELGSNDPELTDTTQAMMGRQIDHMVRLVDDLMDMSRISRGKIDLRKEQVDLAAIIATAMETSDPLIKQREHQFKVSVPKGDWYVDGDADRLTQVISNLLNNAAKYTHPGGRIELTLERAGDEAVIGVKDNGIGIEAAALPMVFDMFAQVDTASRSMSTGGLGIGLNIVKRLVEMHRGSVEGRSEGKGKGSEFIIRLPLMKKMEKSRPVQQEKTTNPPLDAKRVLVVDDNQDAALSMSMLLRKRGHVVEVAHDGEEAITRIGSFHPQVVFMDIGMPRMNGYEACVAIRELPEGKNITIVALSGWGQEEDRRRSEEAGFDRHLVKPIDANTLHAVIMGANSQG